MAQAVVARLQPYGMAVAVEGGTMAMYEWGIAELKKQKFTLPIIKTLKNWTDSVLALAISVVAYMVLSNRLPELAVRAIRVLGSWGIKESILIGIRFRPSVVVTSTTEVEAFNLDPNTGIEVFVDGSSAAVRGTTDGSGYAKVTLPTALDAGTHKVLVHTGFRSAYVEQYVE